MTTPRSLQTLSDKISPNPLSAIRIGLIGAGAIGTHHARVLQQIVGIDFVGVSDSDPDVGGKVSLHWKVPFYSDWQQLIELVDAVVIATPTFTHFEIAAQSMLAGKHVLVEKPLADTVERAGELVRISESVGVHCVVGHVERFNSVIRWLRQSIAPQDILSINITRVGPRPPRVKDVGIVIDLAVHDIDLISHLCQSRIESIQAVCNSTDGAFEDVAQISLKTHSGAICGINTNWLTPYKSRKIEIATAGAFFVGDLVSGVITKYQSNDGAPHTYSTQSFTAKGLEPLSEQSQAFVNLIRGERNSENATVHQGCEIVRLATSCVSRLGRSDLSSTVQCLEV